MQSLSTFNPPETRNTYENMFDSCPFSHGLLPPVPFHISFVGDLRSVLFPQLGFRAGPAAPWVNDALMVKQLNTWWLHNFGRHPHHLNISFRRKTTSIRLSICTWKFTILQPSTLPSPWVGQWCLWRSNFDLFDSNHRASPPTWSPWTPRNWS